MKMKIAKQITEMSTEELVSFVKSKTNDPKTGYILFCKYRSAKPELDAKEFNSLFKSAIPNSFCEYEEIDFNQLTSASME
jgi:hypothetical protein